ncbi:Predicted chaperone lipoprotein YacC, potentially involved in protein secretion [Enterobacter hormaechei]|nr:Predicted chaperone lipoprotein YacC, potentially involved in protein secretion [Enterobacter hormaechei]
MLTLIFRDAVVKAMKTFFQNNFVRQPDGDVCEQLRAK